jgi:acyl-coenzyme A synthetase/AMP-(fatty) acid ligase
LLEQLRQRIDTIFLPRPLLLVEQLPRNATGKLPQQALQAFAAQHLRGGERPP